MSKSKVCIIGVAPEGVASLSTGALRRIKNAEILFGSKRLLEQFSSSTARKFVISHNLGEITDTIKTNLGQKRMVVLATGDPNFFGIARHLNEAIDREAIAIIPNVSSMQLAFARIKESWDDAVFASVHSRPVESIVDTVRSNRKICILTDGKNSPAEVARVLRAGGVANCRAYICEYLGSDKEKIVRTDLNHLAGREFSPVNVMILIKENTPDNTRVIGIPENRFKRRNPGKSLMTKLEVRAVSIAMLGLTENSIVWDIGAGTGAVSIEASSLARSGRVFTVEKNAEDILIIKENIRRFSRNNIEVIHASAPGGLERLPDPDAVFIGGSGGKIAEILKLVCGKLKVEGRIVANVATLENLQAVRSELGKNGFSFETTLLNIARSREISDLTRLEPLNPVFVVTGQRKGEKTAKHG